MPLNTPPAHLHNHSNCHCSRPPQHQSLLNTPPTHLHHRNHHHRGRPPPPSRPPSTIAAARRPPHRQSLRLILHSLPPHRCNEFQRRRVWFQLTTLEPLDSISAPRRQHWEDNHSYYWGILQRIIAENRNFPTHPSTSTPTQGTLPPDDQTPTTSSTTTTITTSTNPVPTTQTTSTPTPPSTTTPTQGTLPPDDQTPTTSSTTMTILTSTNPVPTTHSNYINAHAAVNTNINARKSPTG